MLIQQFSHRRRISSEHYQRCIRFTGHYSRNRHLFHDHNPFVRLWSADFLLSCVFDNHPMAGFQLTRNGNGNFRTFIHFTDDDELAAHQLHEFLCQWQT
jgi:hypothetical protein